MLIDSLDGWLQRAAGQVLFPLLRYFLLSRMDINEESAAKAIGTIEKIVWEADEKLGDVPIGTKFLAGNTFSAANIAFCVHMSLVVMPPENAYVGFVTLANFNYPMNERVEKLQRSNSGHFVSWCYKSSHAVESSEVKIAPIISAYVSEDGRLNTLTRHPM